MATAGQRLHSVLNQVHSYLEPSEMDCPRKPALKVLCNQPQEGNALSEFHLLLCLTSHCFMFLCHP